MLNAKTHLKNYYLSYNQNFCILHARWQKEGDRENMSSSLGFRIGSETANKMVEGESTSCKPCTLFLEGCLVQGSSAGHGGSWQSGLSRQQGQGGNPPREPLCEQQRSMWHTERQTNLHLAGQPQQWGVVRSREWHSLLQLFTHHSWAATAPGDPEGNSSSCHSSTLHCHRAPYFINWFISILLEMSMAWL